MFVTVEAELVRVVRTVVREVTLLLGLDASLAEYLSERRVTPHNLPRCHI